MKKFTLLFTLVFAGFFISAQNLNFNVCGYVSYLSSNNPAANAQIGGYITQGNGTVLAQFSAYTDSSGYFCTQNFSVSPDTAGCAYLSINVFASVSSCNTTQTYNFYVCAEDSIVFLNINACDTTNINNCSAMIIDSIYFDGNLYAYSSGTAPFTYEWYFNNQMISTTQSIYPTTYGQYCVYVTDANGCVSSDCYNYGQNNNTCSVTIYEYTDSLNNSAYLFADFSGNGNPVSYQWYANGAILDTSAYFYPNAFGQYCVTVSDDSGCAATACYYYGQNNNQCFVTFSSQLSSNGTVYFYPYSTGTAPFIYKWTFSDGTSDTSEYPIHTFNFSNGWDYACVKITDANGCVSSYCDYVYVGTVGNLTNCYASFSGYFDDYDGTPGEIFFVDYSWSNNPVISWNWDFGDGSSSTLQNPSHIYSSSGNYNICLSITDAEGCVSNYCETWYVDTAWWSVNPWNGNGTVCDAQFIAIQDSAVAGMVYLVDLSYGNNLFYTWTFVSSNGTISQTISAQYPFINFNQFGCFNVCLTVTDTLGNCQDSYCDSLCVDSLGNLNKATNWGLAVISSAMPSTLFVSAKEEMQKVAAVSVFPNPVNSDLNLKISLAKSETVQVEMYDFTGKIISKSKVNFREGANNFRMDLSKFTSGVYFVKINSESINHSEKVVKMK